ncbi:hypothetical protein ACFY9A_10915 [Streptomyces rubradiris]|uniref:hypothetical protein n=1 Tax=Streptomyces rubradiris TaxID=285531 RepID=UPI0036EB5EDB
MTRPPAVAVPAVVAPAPPPRRPSAATGELPRRACGMWAGTAKAWACVKGSYEISAGRSITGRRLAAPINV